MQLFCVTLQVSKVAIAMDNDIVPALLETIEQEFDSRTLNSKKLKQAMQLLDSKRATYLNVNDFAIELGEVLADVLGNTVTIATLPDGKMYYNIAERILNQTLKKNYQLISNFAVDVQTQLNQAAGINIKGQVPPLNQSRIDGIVERVSNEDNFDDIKWILDDPIVNFSQSIVDDAIKANAEFHAKSGLSPKITRRVAGHACEWCRNLAGTYDYYDAPDDIYRRHQRCRCTVDYNPGDGRRQDVWSKTWKGQKKEDDLEKRKQIGLGNRVNPRKSFDFLPLSEENIGDGSRINQVISRMKEVTNDYKEKTGIDIMDLWKSKQLIDRNNPYNDEKSKFIEYLFKEKGYDVLPTSSSDIGNLKPIYRGIGDFKDGTMTVANQIKEFESGKMMISGAGSSSHGRGIYFSPVESEAKKYADKGVNGKVSTYYISDNTKILSSDILKKEMNYFKEHSGDYQDAEYYAFALASNHLMDRNREVFAVLSGYDAYDFGAIRAVYNRGKVVMKR